MALNCPDAATLAAFVGVLAHKTMATCEACSFEKCPLSGVAARALDRGRDSGDEGSLLPGSAEGGAPGAAG